MSALERFLVWRWTPTVALALASLCFPLGVVALVPEAIAPGGTPGATAAPARPRAATAITAPAPRGAGPESAPPSAGPESAPPSAGPRSGSAAVSPSVRRPARAAAPAHVDDGSEAYVVRKGTL